MCLSRQLQFQNDLGFADRWLAKTGSTRCDHIINFSGRKENVTYAGGDEGREPAKAGGQAVR